MKITLLAVAAMAVLSTASAATTYNVGEPAGEWGFGIDYGSWASSRNFVTGDTIVFKYTPPRHDVLEVSKADYDSCNNANPINTFTTGNDAVVLTGTGTRYFICGITGHCTTTGNGGMKVQIDVAAGSSPSPPAPDSGSNSPPPSPPAPANGPSAGNSPPPPETPSAATSVRATAGLGLVVMLAGLMA